MQRIPRETGELNAASYPKTISQLKTRPRRSMQTRESLDAEDYSGREKRRCILNNDTLQVFILEQSRVGSKVKGGVKHAVSDNKMPG